MLRVAGFRDRRARGFTLVEIMLSILILALTLTALIAMLSHAAKMERTAAYKMVASQAAQDMLGVIESMEFADVDAAHAGLQPSVIEARLAEDGVPSPEATVVIEPYPAPTTAHLKRIDIQVTFGQDNPEVYPHGTVHFETLKLDDLENL